MTALTHTPRPPSSTLSLDQADGPRPETPPQRDNATLDPGARIGLCLAGIVFLLLASKIVIDLIIALLHW